MSKHFKVGDHVRWNSEAGYVSGRIIRVHTRDTEYKGQRRRAAVRDPQRQDRPHRHAQGFGALEARRVRRRGGSGTNS